jgi:hypothetical protein
VSFLPGESFDYTSASAGADDSDEWLYVGRNAEGLAEIAPRSFKVKVDLVDGPLLTLEIELTDDGTPWCKQLTVQGGERPGVTTAVLRELPLRRIVRQVAWGRREPVYWGDDGRLRLAPATTTGRDRFIAGTVPLRAPQEQLGELLDKVAEIYRANPGAPARAVYEQLQPKVSRATAGRYIAQARREGKLGPAIPRKAGEVS